MASKFLSDDNIEAALDDFDTDIKYVEDVFDGERRLM